MGSSGSGQVQVFKIVKNKIKIKKPLYGRDNILWHLGVVYSDLGPLSK